MEAIVKTAGILFQRQIVSSSVASSYSASLPRSINSAWAWLASLLGMNLTDDCKRITDVWDVINFRKKCAYVMRVTRSVQWRMISYQSFGTKKWFFHSNRSRFYGECVQSPEGPESMKTPRRIASKARRDKVDGVRSRWQIRLFKDEDNMYR